MRILGIDPGSRKTGLGVIDVQGQRLSCVHHTVIHCAEGDFAERLQQLYRDTQQLILQFAPDCIAIEDVFVSKNVQSALKLGQARGALIAACAAAEVPVAAYSPTMIKQAVTGFGKAEKSQVQHMIRLLLKPSGTLHEDAADALAVCICHAHHAPMQVTPSSSSSKPSVRHRS